MAPLTKLLRAAASWRAKDEASEALQRLKQLEWERTCCFIPGTEIDLSELRACIAKIPVSSRSRLLTRELNFFDDGCTVYELDAQDYYARRVSAIQAIIALYWEAVQQSLREHPMSAANRVVLEHQMRAFWYQRTYFDYWARMQPAG